MNSMITGFHHVVVFCADTEAARTWYERAGFEYLRGNDGMHWFALGDAEIMLHPGGNAQTSGRPVIHVAVTDAQAALDNARQNGLEFLDHQADGVSLSAPVVRPWGDKEFELQDPDGHWWAFTERR